MTILGSDSPLDRLRVIEASTILAGPLCCQILGDFGADVIKVEHPSRGDSMRVISHRGAFVRTFDRREIVELYEVRAALELHAVRLVCRCCPDEDLHDLDAMLDETESRMQRSDGHAYPAELGFHLRLVMLAGNHELLSSARALHRQLSLARSMSAKRPLRARAAVVEHHSLVEALKRRDVHAATDLMERHIQHSRDGALAALGLLPDEPGGSIEEEAQS